MHNGISKKPNFLFIIQLIWIALHKWEIQYDMYDFISKFYACIRSKEIKKEGQAVEEKKCSDYGKNENHIVSVEMEKELKMGQEENKTEKKYILNFRILTFFLEQKGARMLDIGNWWEERFLWIKVFVNWMVWKGSSISEVLKKDILRK